MPQEPITTRQATSNINESQRKKRCVKINLFNKNKALTTAYKHLLPTWMNCNNAMWMAHSTVNPLQDPQALSALMAQYAYLRNNLQHIRNICRQVQHKQSTLTAEHREKYVQQHCTHLNQLEYLRQSLTEFECRAQQITGPRLLPLQYNQRKLNPPLYELMLASITLLTSAMVIGNLYKGGKVPYLWLGFAFLSASSLFMVNAFKQPRSTTRVRFNPIARTHVFDDQPAISCDSILSSISILGLIITIETFTIKGEVPYGWLGLTCCSALAIQLQRYIQQHGTGDSTSTPYPTTRS